MASCDGVMVGMVPGSRFQDGNASRRPCLSAATGGESNRVTTACDALRREHPGMSVASISRTRKHVQMGEHDDRPPDASWTHLEAFETAATTWIIPGGRGRIRGRCRGVGGHLNNGFGQS